ncbi:MAG: hypothetical protein ATN35_11580 [Epulopiscium sp. Nele67-Bin004]|nr:MAG: hypothetical protein ATN35_11580 [Epulopiscium sp. Nele67-Bin004]
MTTHKEQHMPFYHKRGSNVGVLCIHGLFGSPNQFLEIAELIEDRGYDCKAILLPGHGGTCKDFSGSNYKQWRQYAGEEIAKMRQNYETVYLIGHSMGGLFCIDFAEEIGVDGIVLINTPMKLNIAVEKISMCKDIVFKSKGGSNITRGDSSMPLYSVDKGKWYEYLPWIRPVLGIYNLMGETKVKLDSIKTKALIFQSLQDEVVNYKGVSLFKDKMENKKIVMLKESTHSNFSNNDMDVIKHLVGNFA